ncbi:hemagglutinin/hemolysin-like protein [Psychromonas sp. CNPT3]|uniref:tandem-95 repeat protein n=1 Tax=Psychromonas sp. CNPT3 TaxID=314282 RepID=UPI00006E80AE|nr:Ig-like domain-containing protein [Psychromonas sp. CNPT3]AGH80833.1 hemagglutinin/hemolysin-like protein [Psychromonas sp. CNPT3]
MAKNTTNTNDNKENLASEEKLSINEATLNEQDPMLDVNAQLIDEIEAIQDLIEKDDALIDDVETAAGDEGAGGHSEPITFLRDANETLASSEFQTEGFLTQTNTPIFDENREGFQALVGPQLSVENGSMDEDAGSLTLSYSATDLDGFIVSTVASVPAEQGTVVVNTDGTYTFTPSKDFNGDAIITITTTDNDGATATTTSTVTVNPVNDDSVVVNDIASVDEDGSVAIDVLANDTDIDGNDATVDTFTQGANGTVALNSDGTLEYTPNPDFNGTDSFTYTNTEGNTATVNVTVNPVNDETVIVDDSASVDEDGSVAIDVLANDTDIDGNNATVDTFTQGANGSVTLNSDGTLEYKPNADFNGTDSFTYTNTEGNTATVNVTVNPVNDETVIVDDSVSVDEDGTVAIDVLANDTDIDGNNATVDTFTQGANGSVTLNSDGTLEYKPNADFNGTDSFTYTNTEGNTATVNVTVNPVNDDTVIVDDSASVDEDGTVAIDVLANDTDIDGNNATVDTFTQGANGSVTLNADGTLQYTPAANYHGPDSFTYTNTEGNTATVNITVNDINDAPEIESKDGEIVHKQGPVTVTFTATDIDGTIVSTVATVDPSEGTVVVNSNGTYTFTPAEDFNGDATITLTTTDDDGATATTTSTVTVIPVNSPPVLSANDGTMDEDDGSISISFTAYDVDGTIISTVVSVDPAQGTVVLGNDGTSYIFTPAENFNGDATITISSTDDDGDTSTTTSTVTVNPVNDDSVVVNDIASVNEDGSVSIDVLANDTDIDGNNATIDVFTQGVNGTVALNSDGTLEYTPNADFNGTDSFTYTNSEGNTATVNVTVNPVNDDSVVVNDIASVDEDGSVSINVLANDTDIDGNDATLDTFTQGAHGSVALNADGTLEYTPNADFNGTDSFTYTNSEGNTATVNVTVNPVNDDSVIVNDIASVDEDGSVSIDVLANDTDIDGNDATLDTYTQGANGSVKLNSDGTLQYTPNPDFNGTDSFTYTNTEGNTATVNVTVNPVNDDSVVVNDIASVNEDGSVSIDVLANDTDIDGNNATIDVFTQGVNGTVALNSDGTLEYTPNADFNGTDSFTYTNSEGNTATVNVTVNPVNDDSVVVNDIASVDEDGSVSINVLANDTDIDGNDATLDTFTQGAHGSVALNADGTLEYTPNADFNGTDSFTYTNSEGNTATVNVTVNPVNDDTVIVDDSASVDEDGTVAIDVLANDTDIDGNDATLDTFTQGANGIVTLNTDGTLQYTPNENYHGPDSFTYTNSEGKTATVNITVNDINDGPQIESTDGEIGHKQGTITVTFTATDIDGTIESTVASVDPSEGTVVVNNDGTYTFTPAEDFNGDATITLTTTDDDGATATTTSTVTVIPVNSPPVLSVDDGTMDEDDGSISVSFNVYDVDGTITSTVVSVDPAQGTVVLSSDGTSYVFTPAENFNGDATITISSTDDDGDMTTKTSTVTVNPVNDDSVVVNDIASVDEDGSISINVLANDTDIDGNDATVDTFTQGANGSVALNADGTLEYTPNADFNGTDSFTYTNSEGNTATVNVTVNPVNDETAIENDSAIVDEDGTVSINVLANDIDIDGNDATIASYTQGANGSVAINADGTLEYTPYVNFHGEDSFTYTNSEGKTATVNVTVNDINDVPEIMINNGTVAEDTPEGVEVPYNIRDIDGTITSITASVDPSEGSVVINETEGTYTFIPAENFNGEATITVSITDDDGAITSIESTVTVTPVNDATVIADDNASVDEDGSVSIDVFANDVDIDGNNATLASYTQPEHGIVSVNSNGTFEYTPNLNYHGEDSFTYTNSEGNTATVNVTVDPVNDETVIADDTAIVDEDGTVSINVLANDTDIDGNDATIVRYTQGANGSVAVNADGTLEYTPYVNFHGEDSFTYTNSEGKTATVTVTVNDINDVPEILINNGTVAEDTPEGVEVAYNIRDIDGTITSITASVDPSEGSVVINETEGTYTFIPAENFNGEATITVSITDDDGATTEIESTVTVTPVNDAPDAIDDTQTTYDTSISLDQAPEYGVVEVEIEGNWVAMQLGEKYPEDTNVRFVPDTEAIESITKDIGVGSFDHVLDSDFSQWGTPVPGDASKIIFDAGNGVFITTSISEGSLVAYNSEGTHVGLGIGNASANGINGNETLLIEIQGEYVNEVSLTLGGLGTWFDESSDNATEVVITAYFADGSSEQQSGYRQSGEHSDVYVFNSDKPIVSFELSTQGGNGSYVVQNMTLSSTLTDEIHISTGNADGSTSQSVIELDLNNNESSVNVSLNDQIKDAITDPNKGDIVVNEDENITIDVLENDTDVDGDKLTITHIQGQEVSEDGQSVEIIKEGQIVGTAKLVDGKIQFFPAQYLSLGEEETVAIEYTISDGQLSDSAKVIIQVTGENDATLLNVQEAHGNEDNEIPLNINVETIDSSSRVTSINIGDIPVGAVLLSAGVIINITDGNATLSPEQLTDLKIIPPKNSDQDFDLSITSTSINAQNEETTQQVQLHVEVQAVVDAPNLETSISDAHISLLNGSDLNSETFDYQTYTEALASADNVFIAAQENDAIYGSSEFDTVIFSGNASDYTINANDFATNNGHLNIVDHLGNDSSGSGDNLYNIDRLVFADGVYLVQADGSFIAEGISVVEYDVDINASLNDLDGSESMIIEIHDVPDAAIVIGATKSEEGVWVIKIDEGQSDFDGVVSIRLPEDQNNMFTLDIKVTATEQNDNENGQNTTSTTQSVTGTPIIVEETVNLVISEPEIAETNLILVLDISGSMNGSIEGSDQNRLDFAKTALSNLLEIQNTLGVVNVNLVAFENNIFSSHWVTLDGGPEGLASILQYIENLNADAYGGTNYQDALKTVMSEFEQGVASGDIDVSKDTNIVFLSDGKPGQSIINNPVEQEWNDFTSNYNIDSINTVGIQISAGDQVLVIDELSVISPENAPVLLDDPAKLSDLLEVLLTPSVDGDFISSINDSLNVEISSVIIGDKTYSFDGTRIYEGGNVFSEGHSATLSTANGTLVINFDNGNYSFTANNVSTDQHEKILINFVDTNQNSAQTTLNIEVKSSIYNVSHTFESELDGNFSVEIADGDYKNSNITATDDSDHKIEAFEGDDTLHGKGGNDQLDGGAGNDIIYGGAGDDLLIGDSERYGFVAGDDFLSGGEGNDQLIAGDGNDTLEGGVGNDLLQGGRGDDVLAGDAGADILIGGNGADVLTGGQGNDLLIGGTGIDTFVWNDGDSGTDLIQDFNVAEGDKLDLSELLHVEAGHNIDDYLNFTFDGHNTSIEIFSNGNAEHDGASADQMIILENVDLVQGQSDVIIVNNLLNAEAGSALILSDNIALDPTGMILDITEEQI